jgi:hypothetical protein
VAADDRDDRDNPGARGLASAPALTRVVAVRGVCLTSGPRGVGRGVRRHLRTGDAGLREVASHPRGELRVSGARGLIAKPPSPKDGIAGYAGRGRRLPVPHGPPDDPSSIYYPAAAPL